MTLLQGYGEQVGPHFENSPRLAMLKVVEQATALESPRFEWTCWILVLALRRVNFQGDRFVLATFGILG
jgi:hypothetical protein